MCITESLESAQLLIAYGSNINLKDKNGMSPLNIACDTGATTCIRLLLDNGADINSKSNALTTPLLSSIFNGLWECIDVLYEYPGLDPYLKTKYGYNNMELAASVERGNVILEEIVKWKYYENWEYPGLNIDEESAEWLLHCTVNQDRVESLKILLEYYK